MKLSHLTLGFLTFFLALNSNALADSSKLELLMFEQAGCFYCEKWDKDVGEIYPDTNEGKLASLRRLDIHSPMPVELEAFDHIALTPTFVVTFDNVEVGRIPGYINEDFFWGYLAEILKTAKTPNE